jgi:hypothetical protein
VNIKRWTQFPVWPQIFTSATVNAGNEIDSSHSGRIDWGRDPMIKIDSNLTRMKPVISHSFYDSTIKSTESQIIQTSFHRLSWFHPRIMAQRYEND